MTARSLAAISLVGLFLTGCAVGPDYRRPSIPVPDRVRGQVGAAEAASLADEPWWEVFPDETLRRLIEVALVNGYDLRLAAARVGEARALAGIARSEFFPQVGYAGQWSRSRQSEEVSDGRTLNLNAVDVGLSWEIDLWGRIRRLNEAALAQYLGTEEARRGVLLSLVSEVATRYFELRELDSELAIAKRTRDAFQATSDLFRRRFEAGRASGLETSSAEASLANVASRVPQLESRIVALENEINLLLGNNPAEVPRGAALTEQFLPPDVPPGLPSELLQRRPDLRQAEEQLVAANAEVGVALADFFPRISLTGLFGGLSSEVSDLFGAGKTWSIAGGLVGPLFTGGRLKNRYDARIAQWEQAKVLYERAVTNAFGEVSSALVAHEKLARSEEQQARTVAAYQDAVRLSNQRYLAGLASYLDVLQAEQQLFPAENTLARVRFERLANFVRLYKALGGGWSLPSRQALR
jgi:multidrug efflux system outer membrane protein